MEVVFMKMRCKTEYYDLQLKRTVKVGEELDVAEDRAKTLSMFNVADPVEESTPTTKKVAKAKKEVK